MSETTALSRQRPPRTALAIDRVLLLLASLMLWGAPRIGLAQAGPTSAPASAPTSVHTSAVKPAPTPAAPPATREVDPTEAAIRLLAERELGTQHRLVIQVGQFDTRVNLAPCARAEPFVPPGGRLWGRTQVGIRCTQGASWSIRLPVQIQVFAPVVVAVTPLAAGAAVGRHEVRLEEFDLTRENAPLVTDPATLDGKLLTRAVAAGQPVRLDALRSPPSVNAGDPIGISVIGQGFTITSEGVALTPGSDGQPLRVRTESGRVVAGILRDRRIELRL